MKFIVKKDNPRYLTRWIRDNLDSNWDDLHGTEVKRDLRSDLFDEQDGLCCYCEKKLDEKYHIEHFRSRARCSKLKFDYQNLLISCDGSGENHCGHKKDKYFLEKLVSPLDPDCEERFTCEANGDLCGVDPDAVETVSLLNLNYNKLSILRRGFFDILINLGDANEDEICGLIDGWIEVYGLNSFFRYVAKSELGIDYRNDL